MATKKPQKIVRKVTKKLTDDELILGVEQEVKEVTELDYESEIIKYRITNLLVPGSTPTVVTGEVIETFIGNRNKEARNALKAGAKEVTTYEHFTKNPMYKIEVID
jgi:hypothetical protein